MTSAEMLKTIIPPGYLFHNRGRLGHAADWVLIPDQRRSSPETERVSEGVGIRLGDNEEGQLIYFYVS